MRPDVPEIAFAGRRAALTVILRRQRSQAMALGRSWLAANPGSAFFVALADHDDGSFAQALPAGFQVLGIDDLGVPGLDGFVYRHEPGRLAEALRPFAIARLLETLPAGAELLCLDCESQIFAPLDAVWATLEGAATVLVPRSLRHYHDRFRPGDLELLHHGVLDPGFIALRMGHAASELLAWWCGKAWLASLDEAAQVRSWLELVPALFRGVVLLRDPAVGLSFWNLHERRLGYDGARWSVDGSPLALARFPGFVPHAPQRLSEAQDRHLASDSEALEHLTARYARDVLDAGWIASSRAKDGYDRLPNGVSVPREPVAAALRWAARNGVSHPGPREDPDAFCRFLVSRGVMTGPAAQLTFLGPFLPAPPGTAPGVPEELQAFAGDDLLADPVALAFARLREAGREDVIGYFDSLCGSTAELARFADWFAAEGSAEMGFDAALADRVRDAVPGIPRILDIWFSRGDLQRAFPSLWTTQERDTFGAWLLDSRYELPVSPAEVSLFLEFARARRETFEKMRFLYQHFGEEDKDGISLFAVQRIRLHKQVRLAPEALASWLAAEPRISVQEHLRHAPKDPSRGTPRLPPEVPFLRPEEGFEFRARCEASRAGSAPGSVNLAASLDAASGMGELGRSLLATLEAAGRNTAVFRIPGGERETGEPELDAFLYGWPRCGAELSITAVNADSVEAARRVIPVSHWAARNVACWAWETEMLPRRHAGQAQHFDAIWAPSRYSAEAIRASTGREVGILPCSIDLASIDAAGPDRARFGLPQASLLVGFFLDTRSCVERKNVAGLLAAFRAAFAPTDDAWLVLKLGGRPRADFEFEALRSRLEREPRVIVIDRVLSRADTRQLMRSLDVYASLHRSEGFGFTCAEAMAMQLPVVASGYSGNMDFMSAADSLLVPCGVVETDRAFGPYPPGSRWGEPDIEAASAMLRSLRDRELREDLGRRASGTVRERLAPAVVAAQAQALLSALQAGPSRS